MTESLRDLLVRQAHEVADKLTEMIEAAPAKRTKPSKPSRKRSPRGPVIVAPAPMEMTPEERVYTQAYVRRALGR